MLENKSHSQEDTHKDLYEDVCLFLNWKENSKKNIALKPLLIRKYSREDLLLVEKYCLDLKDKLEQSVVLFERINNSSLDTGSDDSQSDLLAHIISEGYESVQNHINNPKLIEQKYKDGDYAENFLYCIPGEYDFKMTDISYYESFAERIIEDMDKKLKQKPELKDLALLVELYVADFKTGVFDKNLDYDELVKIGEVFGIGASLANMWYDGSLYYGLKYEG
jgi:hypothetical protein